MLLPISIANDGGISGSIQQMTLEVQPEGSTSRRIFTSRGKSVPEAGECYKDKVFGSPPVQQPGTATEGLVYVLEASDPVQPHIFQRGVRAYYKATLSIDVLVNRQIWDSRPKTERTTHSPYKLFHGTFANEHAERDRVGLDVKPQ